SDFEIHNRRIYTASDQGLGAASQIALSRGIDRQWDGEVVRLRASNNGLLAVAAGLDGLRQVRLNDERRLEEPREILGGDFTGCSWLRSSIYGSSQTRAAVLAVFTQTRRAAARTGARAVRTFETYVEDSELFDEGQRTSLDQHAIASRALKTANPSAELAPDADDVVDAARQGLDFESNYDSPPVVTTVRRDVSWAGHGLICRANGPAIDIVRYRPDAALLSKRFDATMSMELPGLQHPVDGDVAPFGVIVESDNDLSVVTAEGVHSVGVTPVKWRTFHRAHNYPNQLHVIAEDRLRIVSYLNEDMRTWGRRAGFGMLADDE
ncbi:MAG: hypothetical protein JWQ18_1635, partial [Conexibacter sp.]|nr:hypothetical protein [Conexibacter sp.]